METIESKTTKPTQATPSNAVQQDATAIVAKQEETPEIIARKEQERTTIKKAEFLQTFERAIGIVKISCEAVDINRTTFYSWCESDPDFKKEVDRIKYHQLGEVEDRLLKAIVNDEAWAISLYLSRVHPKYRPKQENYVIPTEKTLEDLMDDYQTKDEITTRQQNTDRDVAEHPGQEGEHSPVQVQQGAELLLETEDKEESHSESAPKGPQQNHRRRPTHRVH